MNTSITSDAQVRKSRQRVLLLAALFFVPVAVAYLLYFFDVWRPQDTTNKGELVQPPRPLPEIALTLADGAQSSPQLFRGKWTWVYIGDGQCDTRCRIALADIRQARLLLAEKMNRVQRVFLASGTCCDSDFLKTDHPGLIVARLDNAELSALFAIGSVPPETAGRIYLVDPNGNLMMSYAPDAPSIGLLEDIKKLLKLSHIG